MKAHMIISTTQGEFYYQLFYLIAFLAVTLLFVGVGIRRKYALHQWLLIGLSGTLMMIIGMRIATFTMQDWHLFLSARGELYPTGKTSLGGLAGLIIGVGMAQKILKTKYPVLDIYAFILPMAMIFQRVGCLLAGCCFGLPTDSGVGMAYSSHYPVFQHHLLQGLVMEDAASSLPMHPVPLYLMVWAGISLTILFVFRKKFRQRGALFLLSIFLLASGRVVIEFFRDPLTNHQLGTIWMGLKAVQWVLMVMAGMALICLMWREKHFRSTVKKEHGDDVQLHLKVVAILALLVIFFAGIMDWNDMIILLVYFTMYVLVMLRSFLHTPSFSIPALSPLMLLFVSAFFMGQTFTADKKEKKDSLVAAKPSWVATELSHSAGYAHGDLVAEKRLYRGSGCDAQYIGSLQHLPKMSAGYHLERAKVFDTGKRNILGIGFTFSSYQARMLNVNGLTTSENRELDVGVAAYFGRDWKHFGYRLGARGGNLHYYGNDGSNLYIEELPFMVLMQLRIGRLDQFYLKGSLADDHHYGFYRYLARASFGGGFRLGGHPARWELGMSQNSNLNIDLELPLTEHWRIMPSIVFNDEEPIIGMGVRYFIYKKR